MEEQTFRQAIGEDMFQKIKKFHETGGDDYEDIGAISKQDMLTNARLVLEAVEAEEKGDMETVHRLAMELTI